MAPEPDTFDEDELASVPILSVRPAQPFDVLGAVEARLRLMGDWAPEPRPERLHGKLEAQARALEADAVIEVRYDRTVDAVYSKVLTARGTAIRFRAGTPARSTRAARTREPQPVPAAPRSGPMPPSRRAAPALDVPASWVPPSPPVVARPGRSHSPPVVARPGPSQWSPLPSTPSARDAARELGRVLESARRARSQNVGDEPRKTVRLPAGCAVLIGIFVLFWLVNIFGGILSAVFKVFR